MPGTKVNDLSTPIASNIIYTDGYYTYCYFNKNHPRCQRLLPLSRSSIARLLRILSTRVKQHRRQNR